MRRLVALVAVGTLLASACQARAEDAEELRRVLERSSTRPHTFVYREVSEERVFTIRGTVEDDFRYRMTLSTPSRGELIERVVFDDAVAMRFVQPPTPEEAAGINLGHPDTAQALLEGRWALSPSGAPPLQGGEEVVDPSGDYIDPFQAAAEYFSYVTTALSQASQVREFSEEELDYKPSQDPWEYPDEEAGVERYDLLPQSVPKNEDQLRGTGGAGGGVGVPNFRKMAVFVSERGLVQRTCELIDFETQEDFLRAKEEGDPDSFLIELLRQVRAGLTQSPIRTREVLMTVEYPDPDTISIAPPGEFHTGRLERAEQTILEGISEGLLTGEGDPRNLTDCDRQDAPIRGPTLA